MEGVERTNVEMVHLQQRVGLAQHNSYAIDVDRRENQNCYNCGGFGHLAKNYRNKNSIGKGRRLKYKRNKNNGQRRIEEENRQQNLNGKRDLILLN